MFGALNQKSTSGRCAPKTLKRSLSKSISTQSSKPGTIHASAAPFQTTRPAARICSYKGYGSVRSAESERSASSRGASTERPGLPGAITGVKPLERREEPLLGIPVVRLDRGAGRRRVACDERRQDVAVHPRPHYRLQGRIRGRGGLQKVSGLRQHLLVDRRRPGVAGSCNERAMEREAVDGVLEVIDATVKGVEMALELPQGRIARALDDLLRSGDFER